MEALPVTHVRKIAIVAGVAALMTLTSCNETGVTVVQIADHEFHGPQAHLVKEAIPWLPASQSEGLKFLLDPNVRPEEQIIVTMESASISCRPEVHPASSQLSIACSEASHHAGNHEQSNQGVKKTYRDGDLTQWEYQASIGKPGTGQVVASCYALSGKQGGLCTALSNYDDMVYSVGLRDGDIPRLPSIHRKVRELLGSWDRKVSSPKGG
jgi:hypothetical protein